MKKKIFSIIMCVLMVMCLIPSMAFAEGDETGDTQTTGAILSGSEVTTQAGKEFTVKLKLTQNTTGLALLKVEVRYDKDKFELKGVENGDVFAADEFAGLDPSFATDTDSAILVWDANASKVNVEKTKKGTLATLTFKVKNGVTTGDYNISFTDSKENAEAYYFDESDNKKIKDVDVTTTPATIKVTTPTYGDLDGSGSVDLGDVIILERYIAGWSSCPKESFNYNQADLNNDNEVNGKDLLILKGHVARWTEYQNLPYVESASTN